MAEGTIKVKTNDNDIIDVPLDIAKQWTPMQIPGTINTDGDPIQLEDVDTPTLHKIIEWENHHKQTLETEDSNRNNKRFQTCSEWNENFLQVEQTMLFSLIMASNYLGIDALLDSACRKVADMIKGKTPEEVRQTFSIENDLPQFPESTSLTTAE